MKLWALLPLGLFGVLAAAFFITLKGGGGDRPLPSMLVGKPVPAFDIPALEGRAMEGARHEGGMSPDFLASGDVSLVNFWASWCGPCRVEHPVLEMIAADGGVTIHGINYKDTPQRALQFLQVLGDPYGRIGVDAAGRVGVDWGVYGVPETYVIDGQGRVVMRHVGPLTAEAWETQLKPAIAAERAKKSRAGSS